MCDVVTWWLPCLLWLLAAGLNLRECLAYRRARRACEVMQALKRCNALLEDDTHA